MDSDASARMLATRVRLAAPGARRLLVAGPRKGIDCSRVAQVLAVGLQASGCGVTITDISAGDAAPEAVPAGSTQEAGYNVLVGGGILDDPDTLQAAGSADAVILAARRGSTVRTDLQACRLQLESLGSNLVGAVIVE